MSTNGQQSLFPYTQYEPVPSVWDEQYPSEYNREAVMREVDEKIQEYIYTPAVSGNFLDGSIPVSKIKDFPTIPLLSNADAFPAHPSDGDEIYKETVYGVRVKRYYNASTEEWLPVQGSKHLFGMGCTGAVVDGGWHEMKLSSYGAAESPAVYQCVVNPGELRDGGYTQTRMRTSLYFSGVGGGSQFNFSFGVNEVFVGNITWGGVPTQSTPTGHAAYDTGWYDIPAALLSANYFMHPMYLFNVGVSGFTVNYHFISIEVR